MFKTIVNVLLKLKLYFPVIKTPHLPNIYTGFFPQPYQYFLKKLGDKLKLN
jgi:hypothetical protein